MNSRTRMLTACLALAFIVRLVAAAHWHRTAMAEGSLFRLGDSHSYWTLAEQIAVGRPYQYGSADASIFRAPLYPLFLAPWTLIDNTSVGVWCARVAGCVMGTLSVGLLALLANRLAGIRAAIAAALLGAIYPGGIGMSIVILSEACFMPLMLGHLLCWQSAWRAQRLRDVIWYACAGGLLSGAATLARPSWLLFAPFACGTGMVLGPRRPRHVVIFAATLAGIAIVMSPWWIRNAHITGRFVLTTLQVGPSLYDGLHPGATGSSDEGMEFMQEFVQRQREIDAQTSGPLESTFEYRLNRLAQRSAVRWSIDHPGAVLRLAFRKFLRTWSLWPDGGEIGSTRIRLALTVSCFGVLLLALVASWQLYHSTIRWLWGICWLPCLYFTLLHMVFVGSIRYREPAVLVLIAMAGCAVAQIARWRSTSAVRASERDREIASNSRQ